MIDSKNRHYEKNQYKKIKTKKGNKKKNEQDEIYS
jgi:hypothetical protein